MEKQFVWVAYYESGCYSDYSLVLLGVYATKGKAQTVCEVHRARGGVPARGDWRLTNTVEFAAVAPDREAWILSLDTAKYDPCDYTVVRFEIE